MKKIIAAALSLAMILSITACDKSGDSSGTPSDGSAGTSDVSGDNPNGESSGESSVDEPPKTLSNPVKMTEDGDVDMTAALAYETDFDALIKSLSEREVDLSQPVSLNARNNPETMKVWNFLKECYGKKVISAQQQDNPVQVYEDKVYYDAIKDLPAMKGFDFIHAVGDSPNRDLVDAALEWGTESGGLVTFCWHWNVPRDIDNRDKGRAFYMERNGVKIENWNARNATVPGTKEYEVAVHDIDLVASYMQELEAAGITVLWRPLHEASGSWFWWGIQPETDKDAIKDGTYDTFQRLWYMIFDRLENYHKLTNIIWVWNGQSSFCKVEPNSYDIAGIDVYPNKTDHSPQVKKYEDLKKMTYEGKMLALTENENFIDPQQCIETGAMWLYYMPWCGAFVYEETAPGSGAPKMDIFGTPHLNPERIDNETLAKYFSDPAMVTWNSMPEICGEKNTPQRIITWEAMRTPA